MITGLEITILPYEQTFEILTKDLSGHFFSLCYPRVVFNWAEMTLSLHKSISVKLTKNGVKKM